MGTIVYDDEIHSQGRSHWNFGQYKNNFKERILIYANSLSILCTTDGDGDDDDGEDDEMMILSSDWDTPSTDSPEL